jgi:hypothetical protein
MIQIFLAFFGLSAILCTQHPNTKLRRYAPLFGLAGQPFWLWTTWHSQQWGIFLLCIAYTILWGMGVHTQWIIPVKAKYPEDNWVQHFPCWFSKRFYDIHDPLDWQPYASHFMNHYCPHCNKQCYL